MEKLDDFPTQFNTFFTHDDLRRIFAGQCRLLASRADNRFPIDPRSFVNLVRVYGDLLRAEV